MRVEVEQCLNVCTGFLNIASLIKPEVHVVDNYIVKVKFLTLDILEVVALEEPDGDVLSRLAVLAVLGVGSGEETNVEGLATVQSVPVVKGERASGVEGSVGLENHFGSAFHSGYLSGQFIAVARANKIIFYKDKVPCAQIGHYLSNAVSYACAREDAVI